jgi:hypothetical protein
MGTLHENLYTRFYVYLDKYLPDENTFLTTAVETVKHTLRPIHYFR